MTNFLWRTLLLAFASGTGFGLLMIFSVVLWSSSASADDIPIDAVKQGSLFMQNTEGKLARSPLLDTRVNMSISGIVARVTVVQIFSNTSDQWQEGIYVFPLPDDAAVDHLRLWIGERFIEGEIEEREEAKRQYEQAKAEGKRASLLQQERANIFTTSVANIPPGEQIKVEIEYQQSVRYEGGRYSLRFPTVVAPRYIPGKPLHTGEVEFNAGSGWAQDTTEVPDASHITAPVASDRDAVNQLSIHIDLHAGLPLGRIDSPYHEVSVLENSTGEVEVELLNEKSIANRDFVINWEIASADTANAAWFTEEYQGEHYGLLMLVPPPVQSIAHDQPREVILVVDTSGSMHGESIAQAKAALKLAVSRLTEDDSFNLIRFNHVATSLFGASVQASAQNQQTALRWIGQLRADGGTEMRSAMEMALDGREYADRLRQIIFVTDGDVGNEEALFSLIHNNLGSSRLFTVGIGSAPNSFFMTRAAEQGRGSFTYIGDVAEVQDKMRRLLLQLESPVLTDVQVDWQQAVEQWPGIVPDLYVGQPIIVAVKSSQPFSSVLVSGNVAGKSWQQKMNVISGRDHAGLHVLWARRYIHYLMAKLNRGMSMEDIRSKVVNVAIPHHLVSRYTSLVAVDKTPVRPVDAGLDSQQIPVQMPKGWSKSKVFGRLPQTATPAQLYFLLGILGLISSLVLIRRKVF
jgi:Ca-activated chloride channel family protein